MNRYSDVERQDYWNKTSSRIVSAGTVEGDAVKNLEGDDLGTVEHIMLDIPSGRIAYAVLKFGGFLGMGEKLFAIPWNALIIDTDRKCFILDVDKDKLKEAPGFNKDSWPTMADKQWASEIHNFYESPGYWE